ncbi:rRNA-processing protein LAS1 [Pneumocystis jirovecii RU7]|uniref:Uncharacterized protein n=1 Tax=Pneumocystis jirovecii (strain RU7) TaxID=1408657 RepID=A0A0W4ZW31_PNEJ7|nr:rRNA-processing protein LAS1 [Pneumocystis jirovecii RU7]KTW32572.1 hypothetical protein T551_00057 [Pneumocystis jirovecii RU7]
MNHFVHIVPWRSCSEFNEVRDWFFGPSKSQETLIKGLSRVSAWQVRGRVPHAVEATANLTCVLVQEERGTCDPLGLRLSYAMALTRFVNGFLDPEQQGQYAITMQTLARNIDLPLSFVEIRHAATHEQLPSLVLLRSMAIRALEWLLDKYWSKSSGNTIDLSGKPKEKRIEEILRNWEAFQEKNFNNSLENKVKDFDSKDISIMIKECIILCSSFGGIEITTNQLLKKIIALPKDMSKEDFFSKTYEIWLPFIRKVSSSMCNLVQFFFSQIILKLGASDAKNNYVMDSLPIFSLSTLKKTKKKEEDMVLFDILLLWLQTILNQKRLSNDSIKPFFPELSIHKVIQACIQQTDCYTAQLLQNIISFDENLSKSYESLISLRINTNSQVNSLPMKRPLEQIGNEIDLFRKRLQKSLIHYSNSDQSTQENNDSTQENNDSTQENNDFALVLGNGRWRKFQGTFTPLPIGMP